jgi:hypothetical protein
MASSSNEQPAAFAAAGAADAFETVTRIDVGAALNVTALVYSEYELHPARFPPPCSPAILPHRTPPAPVYTSTSHPRPPVR